LFIYSFKYFPHHPPPFSPFLSFHPDGLEKIEATTKRKGKKGGRSDGRKEVKGNDLLKDIIKILCKERE